MRPNVKSKGRLHGYIYQEKTRGVFWGHNTWFVASLILHKVKDGVSGIQRLYQVIMGDCCSWNGCVLRTSEKRKGYFDFKC
jgi:hypothetical protein